MPRNLPGAALCLTVLGVTSPAGADARLTIHTDALNAYADHVGPVTGTGQHAASGLVGDYEWELTETSFAVDATGIRFEADMSARWPVGSFQVLSYTTTVSGTADLVVDGDEVRLSVPAVSFPLVFDIPFVGPVTLLTVTTQLPFRFSAPIRPVPLPGIAVTASPFLTKVDYMQNKVRITTKVLTAR